MPTSEMVNSRLTIIVPSFNQARYLPHTLDSILSQGLEGVQVVVVDGASTDGTLEVLRNYGERHSCIEWVSEPDRGPADAVNKGFAKARGDVIGIQSSDDLYLPGAFTAVLDAFAERPDVGLLWGDAQAINEAGDVFYSGRLPAFSWAAVFGTRLCIPQSSTFFRRSLLEKTSGWNGRYHSCDIEFWLRLLFRTESFKLDRMLSQWRVHPAQRTKTEKGLFHDYRKMIFESPDLAGAPRHIRRYARGSIHVMALDYPPSGSSTWALRGHALAALVLFPECLRHRRRKIEGLLPGLARLHRWFRAQ